MGTKSTDDLQQELMQTYSLDAFLSENGENLREQSVRDLLNQLLSAHSVSKAALAKRSGMSEVYIHQLFSGRRKPSRNRAICLAFGFSATLEETQALLRCCGYAALQARVKRDAIILYGLIHGMDLYDVNDRLFTEDEDALL